MKSFNIRRLTNLEVKYGFAPRTFTSLFDSDRTFIASIILLNISINAMPHEARRSEDASYMALIQNVEKNFTLMSDQAKECLSRMKDLDQANLLSICNVLLDSVL